MIAPTHRNALILLMLLLQFGDYVSTRAALATPSVVELNPLIGNNLVAVKLLCMGLSIALVYCARTLRVPLLLSVLFLLGVINNLALALKGTWR